MRTRRNSGGDGPLHQTLAHLNAALRWNAYAELRDIDDILLADYEPTYALSRR